LTNVLKPRYVLALNASRDQLDRFGEVDTVARLISETMLTATHGIVVNGNDPRLSKAAATAHVPVAYFDVAAPLLKYFPRDDELVSVNGGSSVAPQSPVSSSVQLQEFKDAQAIYRVGKARVKTSLRVTGQHNFQNAAGALALTHLLLPQVGADQLALLLSAVKPAFGRGQQFTLKNGTQLQLNLVKNPASFKQGLASYLQPDTKVMIAINDGLADSRDMSWLWDVDFTPLQKSGVALASGVRAADMALRLQYDEVAVDAIEPDLHQAISIFCAQPGSKVIFATYTAMLKLHHMLERKAGTEL
jgi:lipid II isoglutaminyl synthase (glutamine-hydrolysing)